MLRRCHRSHTKIPQRRGSFEKLARVLGEDVTQHLIDTHPTSATSPRKRPTFPLAEDAGARPAHNSSFMTGSVSTRSDQPEDEGTSTVAARFAPSVYVRADGQEDDDDDGVEEEEVYAVADVDTAVEAEAYPRTNSFQNLTKAVVRSASSIQRLATFRDAGGSGQEGGRG